MTKRIKKPSVKPEMRRSWLRRHEEDGDSPPEIAKKDGFDVRTVRTQIEVARQEREARETKYLVLGKALEKHYADLCTLAEKLDAHILKETSTLSYFKHDPMWVGLKGHLPRSPIWKNLEKWDDLRADLRQAHTALKQQLEPLVKNKISLRLPEVIDEVSLSSGIIEIMTTHFIFMAEEGIGLDKRTDFRTETVDQRTTSLAYGAFNIGKVDNKDVPAVKQLVLELMNDVIARAEFENMKNVFTRLRRTKNELHDEFQIITLRRVVPGRCKYCPI